MGDLYILKIILGTPRETREVRPLLTVETEVNSRSRNKSGPSLVGSLGSLCGYKRFCPALVAIVGPAQFFFFLTVHYFSSFVTIAQQAGQAVVVGHLTCLLMCVSFIYPEGPLLCPHVVCRASDMSVFSYRHFSQGPPGTE